LIVLSVVVWFIEFDDSDFEFFVGSCSLDSEHEVEADASEGVESVL